MRTNYEQLKLSISQEIECLLTKVGDLERALKKIVELCEKPDLDEFTKEMVLDVACDALSEAGVYQEGKRQYAKLLGKSDSQ